MTAATLEAIGYYTPAEVGRLAGVTARHIGRWAREGIILPSISQRPNVYSYADAGEAILAHYLMDQGKSPRDMKAIVLTLRASYGPWPLAAAPLAHDGQLLLEYDADREVWKSVDRPQHEVIGGTLLNLKVIREALRRGGWVALGSHGPFDNIEVDPDRHSGSPVIRDTRIAASFVANLAGADGGRQTLVEDYELTNEQIDDAVSYEHAVAELVAV